MTKTFGKRFKNNKSSKFIGRGEHIAIFKNNLKAEEDYIPIFNIHGQGGVGKTFLSNHYTTFVDEFSGLSVYSDESVKSVLEWMDNISKQFKEKNLELVEFDKRYKVFLQETQKLEADPEKPKGTLEGIIKTLSQGAIKEIKKLPGAEIIGSFINEETITSSLGNWSEFVFKKITNKDEIDLVLNPVKVLTPLFWKDILSLSDKYKIVCFFIDTFEETNSFLEDWLLDLLNEKHGDVLPENILLVIAGRNTLNSNRWSAYSNLIHTIPLEPFTLEEANEFLTTHGILDQAIRSDIIKLSGRLPVLLDWLTNTAKSGNSSVEDACETVVERFLKWITNSSQRQLVLDTALARKFNNDTLSAFIGTSEQSRDLFEWLCKQPFVLKRGKYWTYHTVVREQMLRYIRAHSPKTWTQKHLFLSETYQYMQESLELDEADAWIHPQWLEYEYERLYHSLCAKPDKNIPISIGIWVKKLYDSKISSSKKIGDILVNAGIDNDHEITKGWGWLIIAGSEDWETQSYDQSLLLFQEILMKNWIKDTLLVSFLYNLIGIIYNTKKNYNKSIKAFQKAINVRPDLSVSYFHLGFSYNSVGDKKNAILNYEKSTTINPNDYRVYNNLGIIYSDIGDKKNAIECYQKAIKVKPDYSGSLNNLGIIYNEIGENKKAIECYQSALGSNPDDYKAYNNLGNTYYDINEKEKAIECFEASLKINPEYYEAFYNMGIVYNGLGKKEKAIECYHKALNITPNYYQALNNLGTLYGDIGNKDKAIECYQKALDINPGLFEIYGNIGFTLLKFGEVEKAKSIILKGIKLSNTDIGFMNLGHIYMIEGDDDQAIVNYKNSFSFYLNKDSFWQDIQNDFQHLKQYGITQDHYDLVLKKVTESVK